MSPSNQAILAQLEKLAAGLTKPVPGAPRMFTSKFWENVYSTDFPAILAAVKRLVKIEEAIKFNDGRDDCPEGIALSALDDSCGECGCTRAARLIRAALKEPS